MVPYSLTRDRLLSDLHVAYYCARRHKRFRNYQIQFEWNLERNLEELCDELWHRRYLPQPSSCFIIADPKLREVFAAEFRDRIVHHLYYNYVHEMLERTFIHDSYSCIRKRGTHYGINRLEQHIRKESQNYTIPCYVLKMDIRGYFMHINRDILLRIALKSIVETSFHRITKHSPETWRDRIDVEFVSYLTRIIICLDPTMNCHRRGNKSQWRDLPSDKSLFHSPIGCGLPIGNLTSQLFSNVYMNVFDQYMKRELHCKHFGRYVDDSFVVSSDKEFLLTIVPKARRFLLYNLGLSLHEGKTVLCDVRKGVEYLGAYLKPGRRYVSSVTLRRMKRKISFLDVDSNPVHLMSSLNSFLGVLGHYRTRKIQREVFCRLNNPWRYGNYVVVEGNIKFVLNRSF